MVCSCDWSRAVARHYNRSRSPMALLVLGAALAAGCSRDYRPPPAADIDVARAALQKSLDSWRLRIAPAELRAAEPSIIVHDEDWSAEHRLLQYELLSGEV